MTRGAALEARGLTKYYGAARAVADVSFRVDPGEILGCLGPNGSGKSTTMRMLCGLLAPTRGTVLFGGEPIRAHLGEYKRRLGYVPEEARLYPYLSGEEYLLLVGGLREIPARQLRVKVDRLLHLFGLSAQRHSALAAYSKGMQQKILILAAVMHDPELLILDEPLSGLDLGAALAFRELACELARAGKAILFCSHLPEVIEKLCSRVLIFSRGRIVADDSIGRLRELSGLPSLERVFLKTTEEPDAEATARNIARAAGTG